MKTKNKTGISAAMVVIQKLHREIALCLKTVDAYLFDHWKILGDNNAYGDTSKNIDNADKWAPTLFYRVYIHKKSIPNIMAFVSIVVDDQNELLEVDNPLVTAGFIDYGKGNKPSSAWQWSDMKVARWHKEGQNKFGIELEVPESKIPNNKANAQRIRYLHHPLTSVTDKDSLNSLILEPLGEMLSKLEIR